MTRKACIFEMDVMMNVTAQDIEQNHRGLLNTEVNQHHGSAAPDGGIVDRSMSIAQREVHSLESQQPLSLITKASPAS